MGLGGGGSWQSSRGRGKKQAQRPPGLLCLFFFFFWVGGGGERENEPRLPGRCCFSFAFLLPSPEKLKPSCQALLGKQRQQRRERIQGFPQQFTLAAASA